MLSRLPGTGACLVPGCARHTEQCPQFPREPLAGSTTSTCLHVELRLPPAQLWLARGSCCLPAPNRSSVSSQGLQRWVTPLEVAAGKEGRSLPSRSQLHFYVLAFLWLLSQSACNDVTSPVPATLLSVTSHTTCTHISYVR